MRTSRSRASIQSQRHRKRMLAVRAMAGQTAWLDGQIRWHEGRVVWETDGRLVAPQPADLALAERRLRQIGGSPEAARRALEDAETWLANRRARLEVAKRLAPLNAPELPVLVARAHSRDTEAIARLTDLVAAEALCTNDLPESPSAALAAAGPAAEAPLSALLERESEPLAGRALAALTLGAIRGRSGPGEGASEAGAVAQSVWLRRAYRRGVAGGLSAQPALVARLLAEEDGPGLVRRCLQALESASSFGLSAEMLRAVLARGAPPSRVVALAEASVALEPLAERLGRWRDDLSPAGAKRRSAAEQRRQEESEALDALAELVGDYARSTADPVVIGLIAHLGQALLDARGPRPEAVEALQRALRTGLGLPPALQAGFLGLLVTCRERIWDLPNPTADPRESYFAECLNLIQVCQVEPIADLLARTGDREVVREALELRLVSTLLEREWHDGRRYRVFTRLARDLEFGDDPYWAGWLCDVLEAYRDEAAAQAALGPLAETLRGFHPHLRGDLLEGLSAALPTGRRELLEHLPRLTRQLARIAALIESRSSTWRPECIFPSLLGAVLTLDRLAPQRSEVGLNWALERARTMEDEMLPHVEAAVTIAAILADDAQRFGPIADAIVQHRLGHTLPERVKAALGRLPRTRAALAHLLPSQPRRCMRLLERIGLAARLGPAALGPLDELESEDGIAAEPPGYSEAWDRVLRVAPDLEPTIASYRAARRVAGSPSEVPTGVAEALGQPLKRRNELAYLEQRLAEQPERTDLAKRLASLRARLSDGEALLDAARAEAKERLEQHTAEAWLAAAEQQALACYRARLVAVVGGVAEDVELDDDLLNATLLTTDITVNRRLLLRLLRARLGGDREWARRQPANAAFLAELRSRGIDPGAWLKAHPRVYRCSAVAGGRVRLRLETDPLRILQMGNYFDTCLSFGGINAFSTVANACDLNKRVVYATDGAGRVVGRKLIAIDAEFRLVGFRTYTSLTDGASNEALRAIFRRYCGDFAERCGLRLAGAGSVPTLVARDWYDDGVVPWDEAAEPPETRSHQHAGHSRVGRPVGAL